MLLEVTIGNFRSFRDDVTLSLVASSLRASDATLNRNNLIEVERGTKVLRTAAVYGANNSGKSNLAIALNTALMMIHHSAGDSQQGEKLPMQPFLLDEESVDEPSYIEVVIRHEEAQYRYGFEATSDKIHREWLSWVPPGKRKETKLFRRELGEYTIHPGFDEGDKFKEVTRPNALLLSACAKWAGPVSTVVMEGLGRIHVGTGLNELAHRQVTLQMATSPAEQAQIRAFLRHLDLGFEDFSVEQKLLERGDLPTSLPDELVDLLLEKNHYSVKTIHTRYNSHGESVGRATFDLARNESAGTQRLFAISGPIVSTLVTGSTLIIDEFEARLHARVSRRLVELFQDPKLNPKGAQLVVLTHDTNLLSKSLLRRDQIWFIEKDERQQSCLYSLAEFRAGGKPVRNDASYEPDYIRGRYGAVPKLVSRDELAEALFSGDDN